MIRSPYRYRCIECGSVGIDKRTSYKGNETSGGGRVADNKYYCNRCNSSFEKRVDAKTGNEVA